MHVCMIAYVRGGSELLVTSVFDSVNRKQHSKPILFRSHGATCRFEY